MLDLTKDLSVSYSEQERLSGWFLEMRGVAPVVENLGHNLFQRAAKLAPKSKSHSKSKPKPAPVPNKDARPHKKLPACVGKPQSPLTRNTNAASFNDDDEDLSALWGIFSLVTNDNDPNE